MKKALLLDSMKTLLLKADLNAGSTVKLADGTSIPVKSAFVLVKKMAEYTPEKLLKSLEFLPEQSAESLKNLPILKV